MQLNEDVQGVISEIKSGGKVCDKHFMIPASLMNLQYSQYWKKVKADGD